MVVGRVARGAAVRAGVHHRLARLQHPAHHGLALRAVDPGQQLGQPVPEVPRDRQPVDPGQRLVDPYEGELGVVDGHPDRGLREEAVQHRQVRLDPAQRGHVRGHREHQRAAAGTGDRMGAELQVDVVPFPVAHREHPGPAAAVQDPLEQLQHLRPVLLRGQQLRGPRADGLLRGVTEQGLGVAAPVQDPAVGLDQRGGDRHHQQGVRPLGRFRPRHTAGRHPPGPAGLVLTTLVHHARSPWPAPPGGRPHQPCHPPTPPTDPARHTCPEAVPAQAGPASRARRDGVGRLGRDLKDQWSIPAAGRFPGRPARGFAGSHM